MIHAKPGRGWGIGGGEKRKEEKEREEEEEMVDAVEWWGDRRSDM
jgi:hypothetical protein